MPASVHGSEKHEIVSQPKTATHFAKVSSPDMGASRAFIASSHGSNAPVDQKSYLNEQRLHEHVSISELNLTTNLV